MVLNPQDIQDQALKTKLQEVFNELGTVDDGSGNKSLSDNEIDSLIAIGVKLDEHDALKIEGLNDNASDYEKKQFIADLFNNQLLADLATKPNTTIIAQTNYDTISGLIDHQDLLVNPKDNSNVKSLLEVVQEIANKEFNKNNTLTIDDLKPKFPLIEGLVGQINANLKQGSKVDLDALKGNLAEFIQNNLPDEGPQKLENLIRLTQTDDSILTTAELTQNDHNPVLKDFMDLYSYAQNQVYLTDFKGEDTIKELNQQVLNNQLTAICANDAKERDKINAIQESLKTLVPNLVTANEVREKIELITNMNDPSAITSISTLKEKNNTKLKDVSLYNNGADIKALNDAQNALNATLGTDLITVDNVKTQLNLCNIKSNNFASMDDIKNAFLKYLIEMKVEDLSKFNESTIKEASEIFKLQDVTKFKNQLPSFGVNLDENTDKSILDLLKEHYKQNAHTLDENKLVELNTLLSSAGLEKFKTKNEILDSMKSLNSLLSANSIAIDENTSYSDQITDRATFVL